MRTTSGCPWRALSTPNTSTGSAPPGPASGRQPSTAAAVELGTKASRSSSAMRLYRQSSSSGEGRVVDVMSVPLAAEAIPERPALPPVAGFELGQHLGADAVDDVLGLVEHGRGRAVVEDRKSTRLNSSHLGISYAVFCLKKKKQAK